MLPPSLVPKAVNCKVLARGKGSFRQGERKTLVRRLFRCWTSNSYFREEVMDPVLGLRPGHSPHCQLIWWKDVGEPAHCMRAHSHGPSSSLHTRVHATLPFPGACPVSPAAGTALCYPHLFATRWTGENRGLLKIWKVLWVTFKGWLTEAVTTSQNRNKVRTKRINNEDQIILVLQNFLTPTNYFAPTDCRGPCCEILAGLETFKKRR